MPRTEDTTETFYDLDPAAVAGADGVPELPERYEDLGLIGAGGMGEVRQVYDRRLDRPLAMKIQHARSVGDTRVRRRFTEEARIIAMLQHPAVVPIHDQGQLADGRLWFTMRVVRGKTLHQVITELHAASTPDGWGPSVDGWTLHQVVSRFAQACQAIAYAHRNGVVHRDLKPANIMVGAFGEVQVLDWGVARVLGAPDLAFGPPSGDTPPTANPGTQPALPAAAHATETAIVTEPGATATVGVTGMGAVIGTPVYMSPEQAAGDIDRHSPRSDIYSLGAILYQLLCGERPYDGTGAEVWNQVQTGPPRPLAERRGTPPAPAELVTLCEYMMQRRIEARPESAAFVVRELNAFLEGARRHALALEALRSAEALQDRPRQLRERARVLRREAITRLAAVPKHAPEEQKFAAWEADANADELEIEAEIADNDYLRTLRSALQQEPGLSEAHQRLADVYRTRVEEAERRNDTLRATRWLARLREHDRGRHQRWLAGGGAVTVVTDPPGATVELFGFTLRHRRQHPSSRGVLGTTPLLEAEVPHGSWLLEIRAPGCAPVRYPIRVGRREHAAAIRPGDTAPAPLVLPREGVLPVHACFVPGGWFESGGDPDASDGLDGRRCWVDTFVVDRHPITNAQYAEFLDDLVARGRDDEAVRHAPAESDGIADQLRPAYVRDDDGRFVLSGGIEPTVWRPDCPVVLVDHEGARAFAAWRAARTGRPWRLLHDQEWEKAGRGVDGRLFPCGDHLDPAWSCTINSHPTAPARAPVDAHPVDCSVYGVQGLAGNVRDWCLNGYRRDGQAPDSIVVADGAPLGEPRVIRGGSYASAVAYCRLAGRFAARPDVRITSLGFRLGYSWASTITEVPAASV